MNSVTLTTTAVVTPDGIIPSTYYDKAGSATSYCCDTPYVSAPSSPGRGGAAPIVGGYFYSAPSSPMHHLLKSTAVDSNYNNASSSGLLGGSASSDRSSFEFDFGPGVNNNNGGDDNDDDDRSSTMSSADELFLNGQIRPMKLSTHLQQPQNLAPLIDVDEDKEEEEANEGAAIEAVRGRDWKKLRDGSLRRKTRSLSPLRTDEDIWNDVVEDQTKSRAIDEISNKIENPSASSSRSSSGGTSSSKRWVFLKDFIRNKSDGSNSNGTNGGRNAARLWSSISFSHQKTQNNKAKVADKTVGKLRNGNVVSSKKSAHEVHYTVKRAEAEEMRRKTFLPYKQGLLGCLRFSSKSCHTMDGLARTLNSVSSR